MEEKQNRHNRASIDKFKVNAQRVQSMSSASIPWETSELSPKKHCYQAEAQNIPTPLTNKIPVRINCIELRNSTTN